MNIKALIKKYEEYENGLFDIGARAACQLFLKDLEQLDEPEKVKVPQCVADYIEFKKANDFHVYGAMRVIEDHYDKRVPEWFYEKNIEKFCLAWIFGYEIEKEKRYFVKITAAEQYLVRVEDENFLGFLQSRLRSKFTRKQLEEAGFGWVFDCEGIEIEEVE